MNSHQICSFCALRYASNPRILANAAGRNSRTYVSRAPALRHPAGAAAQRKDDEDEDELIYAQRRTSSYRSQTPPSQSYSRQQGGRTVFDGHVNKNGKSDEPHFWRQSSDHNHVQRSALGRSRFGAFTNKDVDRPAPTRRLNSQRDPVADESNKGLGSLQRTRIDSGTSPKQDDPQVWRPFSRPIPRRDPPPSGFDAFGEAVRASSHQHDRRNQRSSIQYDGRGPVSRFTSRQRTNLDRSATPPEALADTAEENTAFEGEPTDTVEEVESRRRRASRNERYAIDENEPSLSEAAIKAQHAKDRAKDREFAELEAQLDDEDGGRRKKKKSRKPQLRQAQQPTQPRLEIPEFISVQNMSRALGLRLEVFMEKLEAEGFEGARHDHLLDSGSAAMLAELYGFDPILATAGSHQDLVARPPAENISILPPRPPIVTIMGHVDHGKTTILDYLRKANVVASEHGGITQHIGAFSVVMPGTQRNITFLDTPGHAAFLDMRRRGANVTDIVVLVVAADDSVKPQTIEAIKHSLEANVQIIVAINKVDKPDADVERVKQDLTRHDIVVEDYGGDYQAIPISGKTGQGMDALEEAITTLADVSDYRAETDGAAEGWIIESKVTTAGRVATVLVRRGTLRPGDCIVAGNTWARVRTLRNDSGDLVSEALPGTPVQIDGWRGEDPTAGLEVLQADNEQHAKDVVQVRLEKSESLRTATDMAAINASRSEAADARAKVLAWQAEQGFAAGKQSRIRLRDTRTGWLDTATESGPRKVHFVVKADVAGSVEAIVAAVGGIGNNFIQANVIHSGTGMLTESDIRILATSGEVSYAVSFNQPIDGTIYRLAEAAGLEILDHNVIYKVTDAVKEKLTAELPPLITTKVLGEAEVGKIFEISLKGKMKLKIAGCRVTNGTISRANKVRVIRDNETIYTGPLGSLKNVKKDVTEMRKGTECGMAFEDWEGMQEGDHVQCFEEISEPRKLY